MWRTWRRSLTFLRYLSLNHNIFCRLLLPLFQFQRPGRAKADIRLFLALSSCSLAADFICFCTWSSIKEAMSNWKQMNKILFISRTSVSRSQRIYRDSWQSLLECPGKLLFKQIKVTKILVENFTERNLKSYQNLWVWLKYILRPKANHS